MPRKKIATNRTSIKLASDISLPGASVQPYRHAGINWEFTMAFGGCVLLSWLKKENSVNLGGIQEA
eukprot:1342474-Amphidinium_carterae.1